MSLSAIPKSLRKRIFERDAGCCQYCKLVQFGQAAVFHINHIIPRSKGGATDETNLVLQCPYCSLHKADKVASRDPISGDDVPLFHPLSQQWHDHFVLDASGVIRGFTPTGRVTVEILRMNDALPRIARSLQLQLGLFTIRSPRN